MAPMVPPGEPRKGAKPQPLGNFPLIILFTTCTLCAVFLLWRRASSLKTVVAHQLSTWTQKEGRIRLSEDDGPPSREFLEDEYDEDNARIPDDEPLAVTAHRLNSVNVIPVTEHTPSDEHAVQPPAGGDSQILITSLT
ncbi:uncharacterized protein LAESUDRAFT_716290 [Laetiporus sulphureus 93-53]|uniref:Uncharacterized protein n=1 Tax=Laetiporus sulphureus 93-53 TaxID=1314785 RepID=A0A165CR63_9APHY|nr:uncharacterized protein LAESUDRAFT_716290 [Laetiporus sulphureus 93-53]KZT03279.1 hypothetical protein LAESUDRAFT_716290 [Laetiporus sulphureus 93-53]